MRQRKNVFAVLTKEEREADEAAESSDPDEEENIQAVHPPDVEEDQQSRKSLLWKNQQTNELLRQFVDDFVEGKAWWVQCLTIIISSILTYSYNNVNSHSHYDDDSEGFIGGGTNVQIAIMTIITLVGASPFCKTHLLTAGIGAFVGGQNIIGSTGLESFGATNISFVSYLWLIVLGFVVGLIWCFVMNNSKFNNKILDGYSGRLGTTTFIGMNITMIVLWGPLGVVDFNRYYFGFVQIIHIGEEDSAPTPAAAMSSAWKWSEEIELAIGYILAVVWLGTVAGATRIVHNRYVQQWHHRHNNLDDTSSSSPSQSNPSTQPPVPLNNILIPVIWALLCMLIVNATQYKYAPGLYNGFAVGSYVAMASLQKIPTITKFMTVSLVAAGWGLTLTPIFVGFAGKSGFTSMMGHVTHIAIENLIERIRISKRQQQQQQQQQQELRDEQSQHSEQGIEHQTQQHQQQQIEQPLPPQPPKEEDQPQPQPPPPPTPPHLQPKKHLKPREPYLTKQQRRQQQRLQAQQQQQQQQQPSILQKQQQDQENTQEQSTPLLHHRAWSAAPQRAAGDGIWEHPMHNKTDDLPTNDGTTTTTTTTNSEPTTNSSSIKDASSNKLGVV